MHLRSRVLLGPVAESTQYQSAATTKTVTKSRERRHFLLRVLRSTFLQIKNTKEMSIHGVLNVLKAELILKYNNMPGFQQYSNREELIRKIEAVTLDVVESVALGKPPAIKNAASSTSVNNSWQSTNLIIKFNKRDNKLKFTSIMFLLSKIHALLITNQISTRRELYYENTTFFRSQDELDRNMRCISYLLDTPPWELRVIATSKGIVAGAVSFYMADGSVITCDREGGASIPQNVSDIKEIVSIAKWVLIIEKDAAFQKLLDSDGLSRLGPVIFITAKGYPDFNTRLLIRKIWDQLHIPILCLVDADPHGIEIMCTYRFGSTAMSPFSEHLASPFVRWIGVHPSDILSLKIDSQKLTPKDIRKLDLFLNRAYIQDDAALRYQIEILRREGVKAEIEGVTQISHAYIIEDYLPNKIRGQEFF